MKRWNDWCILLHANYTSFFFKKWILEKAGATSQVCVPCSRNHAGKSASPTGESVRHLPVTGKLFSTPFPSCTARLVRNSHQVKLFVVRGKNYRQDFSWHLIVFTRNTCLQAPFRRGELPNLRRGGGRPQLPRPRLPRPRFSSPPTPELGFKHSNGSS